MKLVIKKKEAVGRWEKIKSYVSTDWELVLPEDEQFAAALAQADAFISLQWKAAPPAPKLKLLQVPGIGIDAIDLDTVPPAAWVCNCFGHEVSIAEYVLAAMLEWSIRLGELQAEMRRDSWRGSFLCGPTHEELFGKTLGVIGYGRIGREVARRASAFGMRVIACTRTPKADEFAAWVAPMNELERMLGESDFVLVAAPLNAASHSLIDARTLALMKPTGVIINVARGSIIDEQALYDACRERKIGGAIIDCWYNYPPAGETRAAPSRFPFRDLTNVIMTPHASAWSDNLVARRCGAMAENLDRLARGEALINIVRAPLK